MLTIRKIAIAAGLVAVGAALAHSFGLWLCDECRIGAVGTADAGGAVADSVIFIKLQNAAIHATVAKERRIARWVAGDIITICDGEYCLILVYQAGGSWIPPGGSYPDPKTGYANVQRTGMSRAHSTARYRVAAPAAPAIGGGALIVAPPSVAPGIEPSLTGTVSVGMPTIVNGVVLDWGSFGGSFGGSFYAPIYSGGANDGSRGIADGP